MAASDCHKTRIVKHRFEDQEDDAGYEGADARAADAAFRRLHGGRWCQHCGRRGLCGWRTGCLLWGGACTGPQPCLESQGTGC